MEERGAVMEKQAATNKSAEPDTGSSQQSSSKSMRASVAAWFLAFQTLGVVFGDVGTSPLYVFSSTFSNGVPPTRHDILGAVSLIFWTLMFLPLIKYALVVMNANDNGNGGTFALYSLICRHAKVSKLCPQQQVEDEAVSLYDTRNENRHPRRAAKIKEFLEKSDFMKQLLLIITLLGTCAVIGDGILTPSISVLSSVEGVQARFPSLSTDTVVVISILILIGLFGLQRYGTAKVGWLFAPFISAWFFCICAIGIFNIITHDRRVLYAFNPYYIFLYFKIRGKQAWISLGGIILSITGTEAMFADVSHFSVDSIRKALGFVVLPSVIAAYFGQGAYLMDHPEDVAQTFYKSIPPYDFIFWPMFAIAVVAAIIASQAMISATYSIVQQSQALGCFPRVKIVHTSPSMHGQIYVPEVNWVLMLLCIAITAAFKTTTLIGNAYGIAVVAVMLVTTFLLTLIMLFIWQTPAYSVIAFSLIFFTIELIYFSSNLYKFDQGGYIPVAFAGFLLLIMVVWHYVSMKKHEFETHHTLPAELVLQNHSGPNSAIVPGVGLVYTLQIHDVPPVYNHFLENVHAMHAVVVLVTIKVLPVPIVPEEERFLVSKVGDRGNKRQMMYRCVARYGYMEGSSRAKKATGGSKDGMNFEEALMKSLRRYILEGADTNEQMIQVMVDKGEGEFISNQEGSREAPSHEESNGSSTNHVYNEEPHHAESVNGSHGRHMKSELMEECAFLDECKRVGGITYMLGKPDVRAAPHSSKFKRFVVNVLYGVIHRGCRAATLSLPVPPQRQLRVAMIYEV